MNKQYAIGMSGWTYGEWKGIFYPEDLPRKDWFTYYADQFHTVEINSSFYHWPRASTIEKWHASSPDHFIFTIKAPKTITHVAKLKDTENQVERFYELTSGLHKKLGAHLYQLPPSFRMNTETLQRLEGFLSILPPEKDNVVEFRHPSWENHKVISLLQKHHVAYCNISGLHVNEKVIDTGSFAYFRFHGEKYATLYPEKEIEAAFKQMASLSATKIYAYFNNTIQARGVENARQLMKLAHVSF